MLVVANILLASCGGLALPTERDGDPDRHDLPEGQRRGDHVGADRTFGSASAAGCQQLKGKRGLEPLAQRAARLAQRA